MNVAGLPVSLLIAVRAVVGVLVRQQAHVLANGACTGISQCYGTSGTACSIVVQCVLQRQVLQIQVRTAVLQQVGLAQTFYRLVGRIHDDGVVYRLSDNRDVMSGNGRLHRSVEVVGAVGQEDVSTLGILLGILAVHHFNHIQQTAGVASLHEVPVVLALVVHILRVHNLYTVDVHLATTLHLQRQRTSLALVVVDCRTTVAVSNTCEGCQRLVALLHGNAGSRAILAECHGDDSLRTYQQVDGVTVLEGPSVLCVVPVVALAARIECLVVFGIEELVGQVEDVLLVGARHLYLSLDSV